MDDLRRRVFDVVGRVARYIRYRNVRVVAKAVGSCPSNERNVTTLRCGEGAVVKIETVWQLV